MGFEVSGEEDLGTVFSSTEPFQMRNNMLHLLYRSLFDDLVVESIKTNTTLISTTANAYNNPNSYVDVESAVSNSRV